MNPVIIESLDHEGRGIAHADGKVIFIEGALTGELVTYSSYRKKNNYEQAKVGQILKQSFMRVQPKCPVFGVCGGCSMQHLDARAQVAVKQRVLEDNLQRIGKVRPEVVLPPIYGQPWGYRQRARLSVRHVLKKDKTLVGFREQNGKYVADMQHCEILTPKIASLLPLLGELNEKFTARDIIPQIEVAVGEFVDVLVLRILAALSPSDEVLIREFADKHSVQFWTQTKGPETVAPFYPLDAPKLSYSLPEFGITMPFAPTEFTQVNSDMNRLMISRAMRLLAPQAGERIADFFCGLGNFTLPIARSGAQVLGVEGSDALVKRARQNAEYNGLAANTTFQMMNLFEMDEAVLAKSGRFDKWLVDPPRDGAIELMKSISDETAPGRIVYVSCNPATLARDAEVLVHVKGYKLKSAGVMNMFPQTSHVESIAVFALE
ncbi:23S rRNA (uracil(1939)-C(5))-methyltransferase RlmD [Sideroxyarcus emersonii]|uniref:23S rRNA (uracil(1939)-C(5))-methyltransferase RlmD n=1 Tax=Sideroxyarcus emersonii TaxID=2764705 RepID=A0AAN1XBQ4_9PROT|nr:23S rRNA (uracil(1939)-C(5))-methyltransferase RlmD [Sideroxyarcus emersonii]BCK88244.1 23S rRNA (uracil(1939)-C(5))-methyltransferase RlmD [Sideroxyarcus emersonii]